MTIFDRIIAREIMADIVYEDEKCIAFLDINPVAYGHTLVVPKKSYEWLDQCPDDLVAHLFVIAKKIMLAQKDQLGADFVHIGVMGTEVPHTHIHVIPLGFHYTLTHRHTTQYTSPDEAIQYAQKIRIGLKNT